MSGVDPIAVLPPSPDPPVTGLSDPQSSGSAAHNRAIATGVMWQGALRWVSQVLAWTATVVIARRLSPADYGIAGTAGVLVGMLSLVTDGGLARAVVMRRERDEDALGQIHGAAILSGIALALLMVLGAYPISRFYAEPRLAPVIAALSVVLVLSGANAIPLAVMQQGLQFKRLAAIDFGKAFAQASTVLICALLGFRYWSLAIGLVVGHVVALVWTRRCVVLRARRPDRLAIGATVEYAKHLVVGALAWYVYSNADFAVVGRVAGLSALGYYQFAWNVAQLPGEKLANVLQAVVLPFFGSIGDDAKALKHYFLILSELLVSVMLPVLVGFALVSPIAVPLIFGAKWLESVPIMQVLVICAALGSVSLLSQHVLGATGQAAVAARLNLTALVVLPTCFFIAAKISGPFAVACVWLLAQPFLVGYPLLKLRGTIGLSVREYLRNLLAPAACAGIMTAAVVLLQRALGDGMLPILQLVLLSLTGAVVYLLAYFLLFKSRIDAILAVWRDR